MVKQARAARTRQMLLDAAAAEFDRTGYGSTSLAQVARAAEISLGAVTFHFASKNALANAVQGRGRSLTRSLVDRVLADGARPLCSVEDLTVGLARLLENDVAVRCAARLSRERPRCAASWRSVWVPDLLALLERARL
ncbi:TetR family transcriptional regulator, partial [Kitasatospora sp. NPDC093558]|uniref:TetR family transcriptional regulator n=1 Tax=Kitasatospora sp. NPDC093558 TaxID=3155201 RepID=UPI00344A4E77